MTTVRELTSQAITDLIEYYKPVGNKIAQFEADINSLKDKTNSLVNVKQYGAIGDGQSHPLSTKYTTLSDAQKVYPHASALTDEIDWCAIQAAVNDVSGTVETEGGIVVLPKGTFLINKTITLLRGVQLVGMGFGRFSEGTTFQYMGTASVFKFSTAATAGIQLRNFRIRAASTDANYKNFTGIEVNCAELTQIYDVLIEGALRGMDVTGADKAIYLLRIDNIYIYDCAEEGIYVRGTGQWKNGIYIGVGDISNNKIGIRAAIGEGNVIEGKASEMGSNLQSNIRLEGGQWTIKGSLWSEGSPYGIEVTGGHHFIEGDIRNINKISVQGGHIECNGNQSYTAPPFKGFSEIALKYWFSFDEGSGQVAYDRSPSKLKASFRELPSWNTKQGYFSTTGSVSGANNRLELPLGKVDWAADWTVLVLGSGPNTQNMLALVNGSDTLTLRYFENGIQIISAFPSASYNNLDTFPNTKLTEGMDWAAISYDSVNKKMTTYTRSGKPVGSLNINIPATLSNPTAASIMRDQVCIDEFIVFNRVIDPHEIGFICNSKSLPNFGPPVLTSPNGTRFKLSISDAGAVSATQI